MAEMYVTGCLELCDGPSLGLPSKCGFGQKAQRQSEGSKIYRLITLQNYPGDLLSL